VPVPEIESAEVSYGGMAPPPGDKAHSYVSLPSMP